jgi:hypothetical protein
MSENMIIMLELCIQNTVCEHCEISLSVAVKQNTRWFKYDWDKLWLVYTQMVPVIFEPPCMFIDLQGEYFMCD